MINQSNLNNKEKKVYTLDCLTGKWLWLTYTQNRFTVTKIDYDNSRQYERVTMQCFAKEWIDTIWDCLKN